MKTRFYLFCLLLVGFMLCNHVFAQQQLYVGARVGILFSNLAGSYRDSATFNKTGLGIGLIGEYIFHSHTKKWLNRLVVAPEINYQPKGSRTYFKGQEISRRSNYFSFEPWCKYYFGFKGEQQAGFYIKTAPHLSYLISATETYKSNKTLKTQYYNTFDYGIGAGGGITLLDFLSIDAAYQWGFGKILTNNAELFNRSWGIYASAVIPIAHHKKAE